jgi:hypothetical protein
MFSDTLPKANDSENNLFFKWAQLVNTAEASAGAPRIGDSDNQLLQKICRGYSANCPAADAAPKAGDSDEILLSKILKCTFVCPAA